MPQDYYHAFVDRQHHIVAGVAITTDVCRHAAKRHHLAQTSCVAMGRLLTATALASFIQKRGPMSVQVLGNGHLGQAYADITWEGNLRGYVKNPTLTLPQSNQSDGRHRVAPAVGTGALSVIRIGESREFHQSTTDLISGEIDRDVEHFMEISDQVPTILHCDVLLGADNRIDLATGIVLQAMPDTPHEKLHEVRQALGEALPTVLGDFATAPQATLNRFLPGAESIEEPQALNWKCRCSYERARAGLAMLGAQELAAMVDEKETSKISCEFCNEVYTVSPEEIENVFLSTITAKG